MAFTTAQTTLIRLYLGYPSVYRYENPRLEGAISVVGGDTDAAAIVVGLLDDIDAVFAALKSTALESAGLKSLDKGDVELYGDNQQTAGMRSIGRQHVSRLSALFGVPVCSDVFGTQGYRTDAWMGGARSSLAGMG